MNIEQLCGHAIRLIHAPIHVYNPQGEEIAVYVDHGEQPDIMACDDRFRKSLFEKRGFEHPTLYLEGNQIIYGIVSNSEQTYLIGPCCVNGDTGLAARYLIRAHGLEEGSIYGLYHIPLSDFSEIVIMIY